ncbi:MAG: basic amino acid ABC transporter substrate-binding protein [Cetobacterium sp.]|uniref:basic amino acid ABC transporter substrate-binding protein n=1 Tax=Cetobacterium sp. TaxID=2071632 RepID=UPI003F3715A7
MNKLFSIFIMLFCSISLFGKETLIVGTNAEFPPFEYMEKNKIVGFDIDLINKIGEIIGKDIKISNLSFDGLLPALQAKKIDLVVAGMTVTEERKKFVDFSKDYFIATQVLILPENSTISNLNDFETNKLGTILGYTGDLLASKNKNIQKIQYNTPAMAIMDLKSGKIQGIILDSAPAMGYVKNTKGLKILDINEEQEKYAIALRKGNEKLVEEINSAIDEIIKTGYYDQLVKKYFN